MTKRRQNPKQPKQEKFAKERLRQARLRARARGFSLTPEDLAREIGPRKRLLAATLMGRYEDRFQSIKNTPALLPVTAWEVLSHLPVADAVLSENNEFWSSSPDLWGRRTWVEILRWGLDKPAESCRLLRIGATYGAISIARAQLERWTMNVASYHKIDDRRDNEEDIEYISRVWSVYGTFRSEDDLGLRWAELSEWLHGRGVSVDVYKEQFKFGLTADWPATLRAHERVGGTMNSVLRQPRGAISLLALEPNRSKKYNHLQSQYLSSPPSPKEPDSFFNVLQILDIFTINNNFSDSALAEAEKYRERLNNPLIVDRLATGFVGGISAAALVERRGRAVSRARKAFAEEKKVLGKLDYKSLSARLFRYIAISEMALIVSDWCGGRRSEALACAGAALNSAWYLWLEDTDDSMACVRGVLEQTSRARAHRRKPEKANRVEELGRGATPVRWLEEAGWKRLSSLNRALGEFSHILPTTRWNGARSALTEMQEAGELHKENTARGNALEACSYLLSYEILDSLKDFSEVIAERFREEVILFSQSDLENKITSLLQRSLGVRDLPYGDGDFTVVSEV